MNAERLLKHFDRIAEAPDAIPRLRRFILDLAMRGKLVEQHPNDEPASELLKRIQAKPSNDEAFSIPDSWAWVSVGQIGEARLGKMLDKAKNKGIPRRYLRNVNVRWFEFDLSDVLEMRFEDTELNEFALFSGDVLICEGGEPGRAAVWDEQEKEIYFQKAIHRVRFPRGVASSFFVKALRESADSGRLSAYFTGVTIKHFTGRELASFVFPLPPLAEQQRIVAKVDELMGLCDRLETAQAEREHPRDQLVAASLHRLNNPAAATEPDQPNDSREHARFYVNQLPRLTTRRKDIQQLRQTILNLAVCGELVPQDSNDEPATELLKSIQAEKARLVKNGRLRAEKPLPAIDEKEIGFETPQGWKWVRLGQIIKLWSGFAFRSSDFQAEGVPVIRIGDLQDGEVVVGSAVRVSHRIAVEVGPEVWIPPDALLIAMSGATTGKVAFNRSGTRLLLNQRVGRIEVIQVSIDFIRIFFETIIVRNLSISFGTAIPNLSAKQINETALPLPPLPEQHRIVAKVNELMMLCDQLEAQFATAQADSRRLLEAVLHEALYSTDERYVP